MYPVLALYFRADADTQCPSVGLNKSFSVKEIKSVEVKEVDVFF